MGLFVGLFLGLGACASSSGGSAAADVGSVDAAEEPAEDAEAPSETAAPSTDTQEQPDVVESVDAAPDNPLCESLPVADDVLQVIDIASPNWESITGTATRWERAASGDAFCPVGEAQTVVFGKSGLGWGIGLHESANGDPEKAEGDGRSPAGLFELGTAFGLETGLAPAKAWPYLYLSPGTHCVDDAASAQYNQIVQVQSSDEVTWSSSEKMETYVTAYRLGVVVHHNQAESGAVPGAGSCIFLHVGEVNPPSPTAGCTALPYDALLEWVNWLDPVANPVVRQLVDSQ